jgi:hypothetical protein
MPVYAIVNDIVIAVGLMIMLIVYWHDELTRSESNSERAAQAGEVSTRAAKETPPIYLDYPFLKSAYWYFFAALGCVLVAYFLSRLDDLGNNWSPENKELLHFFVHVPKIVLSNVANVALLISALAYGRAQNFKTQNAKRGLAISALLFALWAFFWELLHHDTSLIYTTLLVSPDVVVSNVALILLGWVFLSRWTGIGVIYFLIVIAYAVLQLPARIAIDLGSFLDANKHPDLEPTFYLLAVGKIFIIGGFILMVRNVGSDTTESRFWPGRHRTSLYPVSLQHVVLALLFAFLVPFILHWAGQAYGGDCCTLFPVS